MLGELLNLVSDISGNRSCRIKHYESPAFNGRNDLTNEEKEIWTGAYNTGFGNGFRNGAHKDE